MKPTQEAPDVFSILQTKAPGQHIAMSEPKGFPRAKLMPGIRLGRELLLVAGLPLMQMCGAPVGKGHGIGTILQP